MLRFASSVLSLALASLASADLYWTAASDQDGDFLVTLVETGNGAPIQVEVPAADLNLTEHILITAEVDEPAGYWAIHVDWTTTTGSAQRTTLLAEMGAENIDGATLRPRWNLQYVEPQPLDGDGEGPYARFRIDPDPSAGMLLHMVQTDVTQPRPLEHAIGDVNADGSVNVHDLLIVIDSWSPLCDPDEACQGDADFDGDVDSIDILQILAHFNDEQSSDPLHGGGDDSDPVEASHVAWTWAPVTEESATNLVSMIWAPSWSTPEEVAAQSLTKPEGHRVVFFFANIVNDLAMHPEDAYVTVDPDTGLQTLTPSPWIDHGIEEVRNRISEWLDRFIAAGGDLDAVIVDNEHTLGVHRFLTASGDSWTPVMNDPRFVELEAELGFNNLHQIAWGTEYATSWNSVMGTRFDEALNEAVFDVIRNAFPDARCSNYMSYTQVDDHPTLDLHGHTVCRESPSCGTHDAFSFYGRMTQWLGAAMNPAYAEPAELGEDPWGAMMVSMHRMRSIDHSTDRPLMAWVTYRDWPGDPGSDSQFVGSAYYDEMVLQLGMHGVREFIYWVPQNVFHDEPDHNNSHQNQTRLDNLMQALSHRVGDEADRSALSQVSFNEFIIATPVTRGDATIWRVSFREDVAGVELRFEDGETVYLHPDSGELGTWYEHDSNRRFEMNVTGSGPLITGVTPAAP
ncbi:MAG: dockerin type I repeat-containing protein [Phycisphaerales bacterium]|nr:dockerin type I repeat-containing protein [Phycisphaerales bacterium]